MSSLKNFSTIFLYFFTIVELTALKCYVCSNDGKVSCKNFDKTNETFIQECNPTDRSCSLEIKGSKTKRSCHLNQLDDCLVANEVEYCFCSWDLCNEKTIRAVDTSDDEDFIEGSGTKIQSTSSTTEISVERETSSSDNMESNTYVILILLCAIFV